MILNKTTFMQTLQSILIFCCIILVSACQQSKTESNAPDYKTYLSSTETGVKTGGIKMISIETPKGKFNVWTKRVGNNPKVKLLLLHGGPAVPHEYFECFDSYLPQEGIEYIYYDQLGAGNSDHPQDTSLWDLARSVEEVEQVRQALGLNKDNFYLLGHSWGGILAMEYSMKYQQHLKGLIISNMMADCVAYDKYAADVLAKQIDPKVLAEIQAIEAKGDFANPRYMELLTPHFYTQHICRLPLAEWPEPMTRALGRVNSEQYVIMQGPSEFGISGKLEKWDRSKDLGKIKVPTLVIGATHDTMDPKYMEWMSKQIPGGKFLLCPKGGHMCMWDDQEAYFAGLIPFLKL
jgi:proline iminopeptidase